MVLDQYFNIFLKNKKSNGRLFFFIYKEEVRISIRSSKTISPLFSFL
jgi:hypothetical protein